MMRDVMMCCKSVGTDLSMLDIDDFMTEISQLKKEVALLETKLRLKGDEGLKREDSELSLTLLCYTESNPTDTQDTTVCDSNQGLQDDESTDQTSTESLDSVCNAGEQQQILQTTLKMEVKTEPTEEEHYTEEDYFFIPSDEKSYLCCDGEITCSRSEERLAAQTLSCITGEKSKVHTENKKEQQFHCEQCRKICVSSSKMKHHMITHSGEKPYYCTKCGKYFSTKGSLDVHKRIHTGEKPYKCPHCEKRFRDPCAIKTHMRLHSNERHQCSQCDKIFKSLETLRRHQKLHSEKLCQCPHCDKRFHRKSDLLRHEKIHTGEKPYFCSQCGKGLSDLYHFRVHQRVHTGEKPYHCSVCGKSYSRCDTLVRHQIIHTGEKPYKCSQCDKKYTQSSHLKIHQRVHTGEKPYVCSHCGERFTHLESFKIHQKKHAEVQTTLKSSKHRNL